MQHRRRRTPPPTPLQLDVYVHFDRSELGHLFELIYSLRYEVMSALSDLQAEVTETGTVVDSAITLLEGLKAQLDEAIATGDPASLVALSTELDAKTKQLAAAVAANTTPPTDEPPVESAPLSRSRR